MVSINLLGPVELRVGERPVEVGPRQRRLVLAALAVDVGLVVPLDTLIHRVWDRAPEQERAILRVHVSRLRRILRQAAVDEPDARPARLVCHAAGYQLQIDPEHVDLHRFRELVTWARAAADPAADALYGQAFQLWRGAVLAGVDGAWTDSTRLTLGQERMSAELEWTDVRLRLGQHTRLVDGLAEATLAHPFDERLAGQYMLALSRCGRQADALAHYERIRKRLDKRVGMLSPPLRELRRKILTGDPGLWESGAGPTVLRMQPKAERTLPGAVAGFVGRRGELRRLLAAVDAGASGCAHPAMIHAVDGMAGTGKTAFVVHAAHQLASRYPDGQRYLDLRAHALDHAPMSPAAALTTLLQADGLAADQIPSGIDALTGLWRERAAGKRMLLVLDDAADIAHVTPLLPASPGSLVLITSRRKLTTLPGGVPLSLSALPANDAAHLFVERAGTRARNEPAAVARVVRLCGHLPLAITSTAARFHLHPAWTVTDLADDLDQDRFPGLAVAARFDTSYRDLPPDRQRLYRRLGLHPGSSFDCHAAAALDDTTVGDVRRGMETLLEHNLLTEPRRDRYRFPDLVAEHARTRAGADPEPDRVAALDRLVTHYRRCGQAGWPIGPATTASLV